MAIAHLTMAVKKRQMPIEQSNYILALYALPAAYCLLLTVFCLLFSHFSLQ
jgi:hypothetical protein